MEHRKGEIRDITREMLYKAGELCAGASHELVAVVLAGEEADGLAREAAKIGRQGPCLSGCPIPELRLSSVRRTDSGACPGKESFSDPYWTYVLGNGCGACAGCQVGISPGDGLREYPAGGWKTLCHSADLQRQAFFESVIQEGRRLYHYSEIRGLSRARWDAREKRADREPCGLFRI